MGATEAGHQRPTFLPLGVAVDAPRAISIADTQQQPHPKVAAPTGIITTVAGNGRFGYVGDGGAATSAQLNFLGRGGGWLWQPLHRRQQRRDPQGGGGDWHHHDGGRRCSH